MKAFEYLKGIYDNAEGPCPRWRYKGSGFGQGLIHLIGLLEPHEVVTCSGTHGWLGTPEDFVKQFDLLAA
ncbi:MAG: hypothetical protein QOE26_2775 [Verrucomicrobiota bacterium]